MTRTQTVPRLETGKGVLSMLHAVFQGFRTERTDEALRPLPSRKATEIDFDRAERMVAAIHARSAMH